MRRWCGDWQGREKLGPLNTVTATRGFYLQHKSDGKRERRSSVAEEWTRVMAGQGGAERRGCEGDNWRASNVPSDWQRGRSVASTPSRHHRCYPCPPHLPNSSHHCTPLHYPSLFCVFVLFCFLIFSLYLLIFSLEDFLI